MRIGPYWTRREAKSGYPSVCIYVYHTSSGSRQCHATSTQNECTSPVLAGVESQYEVRNYSAAQKQLAVLPTTDGVSLSGQPAAPAGRGVRCDRESGW